MKHEDPLARFVAHRLREWMALDPENTQSKAARVAKVSKTQISNLLYGSRGAGKKTMKGIATVLGTTWAQLEAEAEAWAVKEGHAAQTHPNLATAIRIGREGGIDETAILDVIAEGELGEEQTVLAYLERMRYREMLLRAQRTPKPASDAPTPAPVTVTAARGKRG